MVRTPDNQAPPCTSYLTNTCPIPVYQLKPATIHVLPPGDKNNNFDVSIHTLLVAAKKAGLRGLVPTSIYKVSLMEISIKKRFFRIQPLISL